MAKAAAAPVAEEPPRRVQPRGAILRVELDGDYAGWWLEVDRDFTLGQLEDLQSRNVDLIGRAIADMVTDWNFVDKRGEPIEAGPGGARRLGLQLVDAMTTALTKALQAPKP